MSLITVLLSVQFFQPVLVNADTTSAPTVSIVPQNANSDTITVHFSDEIAAGNIIDLEIVDSSNNRVWQQFTDKGGNTFSATASQLPNGTYVLKGGLFSPDWQSTTAWFDDLATITIPTQQVATTPSVTPSISPSASQTDSQQASYSALNSGFIATPTPSITPTATQSGTTPTNTNESNIMSAATTAYQDWKNRFLVAADGGTLRVQRPENSNDTVSEGIGYGMLLATFAKDRTTFDGLWAYAKNHLDTKGLMNWDISSSNQVIGSGSATDADEDMAYALGKASLIWPGNAYDTAAKQLIDAMKKNEIMNSNLINPGDNWGNTQVMDPSYIAPSYYRMFAQISGDNQWNDIAQANSDWMAKAADKTTGLLPDWINADFSAASNDFDQHQHDFWYDAVRTPIRMLMTYSADKDPNAQAILQKQAAFYNSVGADKLLSGYTMSGSPITNYLDTTFLSGYTAAGQVASSSSYAQAMINKLIVQKPDGYFGSSLRTLTLFVIANPQ